MSLHVQIQQNHQETKKNKKNKDPFLEPQQNHRESNKKQNNQSSHTLWGVWVGQDGCYYRGNLIFWWNSHDFRDNIWHFCDNESHPGQPRPPIVCENFGFFGFFWFSQWFCYGSGKGSLFFCLFWFLEAFGNLWDVTTWRSNLGCKCSVSFSQLC